ECLRQRAHHQRFRQPRHADQQGMAAAEDRHEQFVEHFFLADDDLPYFTAHLLVGGAQGFEHLDVGAGRIHATFLEGGRVGEGWTWVQSQKRSRRTQAACYDSTWLKVEPLCPPPPRRNFRPNGTERLPW